MDAWSGRKTWELNLGLPARLCPSERTSKWLAPDPLKYRQLVVGIQGPAENRRSYSTETTSQYTTPPSRHAHLE